MPRKRDTSQLNVFPQTPGLAGVPYPPEVKARAIALLLCGTGVRRTARELGVGPASIRLWRRQWEDEHPTLSLKALAHSDDLIATSVEEYLDDAFQAISAWLAGTADPAWIAKQSASELAVIMGVTTDKVINVLDRLVAERNRSARDGDADRPDDEDAGPAQLTGPPA